MTYATVIFCILAVLLSGWTMYCAWKRPGAIAIILFASVLLICYLSTVELLGRPKPIQYELRTYESSRVLGYKLVIDEAIYMWTEVSDGSGEPLNYVHPWDPNLAIQLQEAFGGLGFGEEVILSKATEQQDPNGIVIHKEPVIGPPPKTEITGNPHD